MREFGYNGWPNFSTWQVNSELFSKMDPNEIFEDEWIDVGDLTECLRGYAQDYVNENTQGFARGWARAFLLQVNFYEIAKRMMEAYPEQEEA